MIFNFDEQEECYTCCYAFDKSYCMLDFVLQRCKCKQESTYDRPSITKYILEYTMAIDKNKKCKPNWCPFEKKE